MTRGRMVPAARGWFRPGRLAVLLVLALTAAALWGAQAGKAPGGQPGMAGKMAPDFALTDLSGSPLRLSDFKGKVVLLDFWATWCDPCRHEIPILVRLQNTYRDKGFTVLGISLDINGPIPVKAFARKMRINYPVAIGNNKIAKAYGGIQALPTVFLIGRDGKILKVIYGEHTEAQFKSAIRAALQKGAKATK